MEKPSSGKGPAGGGREASEKRVNVPETDVELLAECRVDTFRAGGKGGQHQNKTESGVRLTHGPSGVVVTARESRSQMRNRDMALARLRARLEALAEPSRPRIATKVPLKEKRKRVEDKKRRSRLKRQRRKPESDDD